MTAAARSSPNHVASPERWMRQAHVQQPELDGGQAAELADQLRADHYRALGRQSAESRRAASGQGMTTAATASPMHPNSPARWPALARQQHPRASEDEITAIAAELRAAHYRRIWETRRGRLAATGPQR